MGQMIAVKKVVLNQGHLSRVRHTVHDGRGKRTVSFFAFLVITQWSESSEYFIQRVCEDGETVHTHHETLADALETALWEFDVQPSGWSETTGEFRG